MSLEMENKNTGRDQEFDSGHAKFEVSMRHPSVVLIRVGSWYLKFSGEVWTEYIILAIINT